MLILDRFEGDWVIVEWQEQVMRIPKQFMPAIAKEGDILLMRIDIDEVATLNRKNAMQAKLDDLFE